MTLLELFPGSEIHVGPAASVQFVGANAFNFRVIRVEEKPTYEGWAWLDGYQLNSDGDAVARRSIFVRPAGLRQADPARRHR